MSRSTKKAITKDTNSKRKKLYWRTIRRNHNNSLKKIKFMDDDKLNDFSITNPKLIYNDWDYCDWKFDLEYVNINPFWDKLRKKFKRK